MVAHLQIFSYCNIFFPFFLSFSSFFRKVCWPLQFISNNCRKKNNIQLYAVWRVNFWQICISRVHSCRFFLSFSFFLFLPSFSFLLSAIRYISYARLLKCARQVLRRSLLPCCTQYEYLKRLWKCKRGSQLISYSLHNIRLGNLFHVPLYVFAVFSFLFLK